MELLLNLGCLETKGKCRKSFGLFICSFCLHWIVRQLSNGKKSKSCGCQLFSEEHRQKLKDNRPNFSGKNNPFYGKQHTDEARQKIGEKSKGRFVTKERKQKISSANKGKLKGIPKTEEHKQKIGQANKGKKRSEDQRQKMSKRQIGSKNPNYGNGDKIKGELNPQWLDGKSFEPYTPEFNKELKQFILKRDNYTCQCPDCEHKTTILHIHHIDYDKLNSNMKNLITLCNSCHSITNVKSNRQYWTEFYQNIMMNIMLINL